MQKQFPQLLNTTFASTYITAKCKKERKKEMLIQRSIFVCGNMNQNGTFCFAVI